MSVMSTPDIWSGEDRMLTVEDMESMPDDEFRYELDDGVLIVSPAPSPRHQLVVARLTVLLTAVCPAGLVVLPGVGINVTRFQHRVPDLAVVDAGSFGAAFVEKPPLLAVEVASPRTRMYDRNRKKDVYESFGIPSYWIVDPDPAKPVLTVFELVSARYREVAQVTGSEPFHATQPFPVTVAPVDLVTLRGGG
jgi:Uma2 family endonuclease